jgi:hypothetical protein
VCTVGRLLCTFLESTYSFLQELAHLLAEVLTVEGVVYGCLEEAELITRIITISLHLKSIDLLPILYHTLESISQSYLSISRCTDAISLEILEHFRSDDILPDHTKPRCSLFWFWFFEELTYLMDFSFRAYTLDDTIRAYTLICDFLEGDNRGTILFKS